MKIDANSWYWQINSSYPLNDLRNLNEIFRKDIPYDNIKSHKKAGFHPLCRRHIFQKTTGGDQIDLPSHFRFKSILSQFRCSWEPKDFLRGPAGVSEYPQTPQLCWRLLHSLFFQLYSLLGSCVIVAYRAPDWRKVATDKHFFFKTNLFKEWMKKFVALLMREKWPEMNGKMMTPTFFELYTVYIKKGGQFFPILYLLYVVLLQVINIFKS